jgi:phosphoribosylformimino-5-aminoimidazole carboxamide ribotide isomerase
MKIIAAVDIMSGSVVRLVRGDPTDKVVYSSDPVGTAKRWEAAGADMLHVVDLDAALSIGNNLDVVSKVAAAVKIPVQAAGGIRSQEAAENMLSKTSKIVLGTMAHEEGETTGRLAKKYAGRIVISIDQTGGKVMVKGWKESTGLKVDDAIARFKLMGIDEFLLTSIDRDGTLQGPDVQSLANACSTGVKIIASGGIASVEDVIKVRAAGCSSVILGKAMYDGKLSIERAKAVA